MVLPYLPSVPPAITSPPCESDCQLLVLMSGTITLAASVRIMVLRFQPSHAFPCLLVLVIHHIKRWTGTGSKHLSHVFVTADTDSALCVSMQRWCRHDIADDTRRIIMYHPHKYDLWKLHAFRHWYLLVKSSTEVPGSMQSKVIVVTHGNAYYSTCRI